MTGRAQVLIVDDEPANRELLAALVRLEGCDPVVVSGGAEALAVIERGAVDVVFLDMMMPAMSGLEVLEQLAERGVTPGLPVVAISVHSDRETRIEALERGATDFLSKPIDRHELAARLRTLVRLKTLHDQLASRLRDSEKMHGALMAGAAAPIVVLDTRGRVVEANAVAESYYEPASLPLVGKRYADLVAPAERARVRAIFVNLLVGGAPVEGAQLRVEGRGGKEVLFDVTASIVDTDQGRFVIVVSRDVTEERGTWQELERNEQALAESAAELGRAQAVARVGSWYVDLTTGLGRWSPETHRIFGVPEGTDVSFATVLEAVHPDDRDGVAEAWSRAAARGELFEAEHRIVVAGEERWVRVRAETARSPEGRPLTTVGTIQDVTDRKLAELAREESLRFSREVLDSLTALVAIVDERGVIVAANRAWRDSAVAGGASLASTAEGASYLAVCEAAPEGVEVAEGIRRALSGEVPAVEVEYRCDSPSEERWYSCRISRFRGEGPPRVVVAHHDVTRFKEAQMQTVAHAERLDLLAANLPLVLWEGTARAGGVPVTRWVSENAERILGVSANEIVRNSSWIWHVHTAALPGPEHPTPQHPATWLEQYRWHRPDGALVHLQAGASARANPDGSVSLLGFVLDISESKKLEAALLQAQKMEAIGQLTGGIAHDFNNLLAVVLCFAGIVRDDLPAGHPARADIAEVIGAAERAAGLTRQLLLFSRKEPPMKRSVDLNESVAELHKILQRAVGERISVESVLTSRPAVVWLDPGHFDQVLLNLAVNARDAMPIGGRLRIAISHPTEASGAFSPGGYVRVRVSDTGSGMDRKIKERLFEPFFTTKGVGKGTGLGLATSQRIVQDAGGTLRVESEPGAGTTFEIDLPLSEVPVEPREGDAAELQRGNGERILVVEDDPALRGAATRILESAGFVVHAAADADAAFRLLVELGHGIDGVVSDAVLPRRSGYEVLDRARELNPGVAVVLTSGYVGEHGSEPPRTDVPHVWKPYTQAILVRVVLDALKRARGATMRPSLGPSA